MNLRKLYVAIGWVSFTAALVVSRESRAMFYALTAAAWAWATYLRVGEDR